MCHRHSFAERHLCPVLAALFLLTGPARLHGQAAEPARQQPGKWNLKPIRWSSDFPADARPRLTQAINEIVAVLRKTQTLAQPRGFDVNVDTHAEWHDLDNQLETGQPKYTAADISVELVSKTGGQPLATIGIRVNDLSLFAGWEAGHGVSEADAGARFLNDPPEPFEMRGEWPVYHDSSERESWVVMTRAKVPVFAPVPRERYLRYEIAETQKVNGRQMATLKPPPSNDPQVVAAWKEAQRRMAEIRQTFDQSKAAIQKQLDALNQQLAGATASDRQAPTYFSNPNPTENGTIEFLQRGDPDAKAVVYRNRALMNDRLPRGTPQILTIRVDSGDEAPELASQLEKELEWAALEKTVVSAP
jgi:hypothetical protein